NYPNPFNPTTTISYTLKETSSVKLTVYDRLGREVKVLVDENQNAGTHTVEFNASSLPSGIYFYRIKANDKTEVKKMIFAK
ncbi:MAG: T9SS type A sorting domain-containing protein, partial [Ignavibacteriae bacterium]|nr:T9SS type A sorting domain-containing protein [Ignavibacteriota bacterium]